MMLFLIGAIALALIALGTTWGTVGTVLILITTMVWLALAFRPVEAGALVTNLTRRHFE
jgi:TM2 domain-containing membrane protein YozV